VGELIRTGQLTVPPPPAPKSGSPSRRRPARVAVSAPSPTPSDEMTPAIAIAVAPATEIVDVSETAALQGEDADDAVKRIRLAAVIARADLERIQAEALRDEATRLLTEAARGRRLEYLVGATLETVLPWEREFVEPRLRQLLTGSDLEDSFALRALIAGAVSDARVQLVQPRELPTTLAQQQNNRHGRRLLRRLSTVHKRSPGRSQVRPGSRAASPGSSMSPVERRGKQLLDSMRRRFRTTRSRTGPRGAPGSMPSRSRRRWRCRRSSRLSTNYRCGADVGVDVDAERRAHQDGRSLARSSSVIAVPPTRFILADVHDLVACCAGL
jgi:hypothetical protein